MHFVQACKRQNITIIVYVAVREKITNDQELIEFCVILLWDLYKNPKSLHGELC